MSQEKHNWFDEQIKSALEGYETTYDHSSWEDMEKQLNRLEINNRIKLLKRGLWTAAILSMLSITGYFVNQKLLTEDAPLVKLPSSMANLLSAEDTNEPAIKNPAAIKREKARNSNDNKVVQKNPEEYNEKGNHNAEGAGPLINRKDTAINNTTVKDLKTEDQKAKKEIINETTGENNQLEKETVENNTKKSYSTPKARFYADKETACVNATVHFHSEKTSVPVKYHWEFGDGNVSEQANPNHLFSQQGNYQVSLTVTSLLDGSTDTYTLNEGITVHPVPMADFDWKKPERSSVPEIIFSNKSFDGSAYSWRFGDKEISKQENPGHLYQKKGYYQVALLVTNSYGCSDSAEKTIRIEEDYNLLAPNAFSPNGDGLNDDWLPFALVKSDLEFALSVIDVYSNNVVFHTTDRNTAWDGRLMGASNLAQPGETYGWFAKVKYPDGNIKVYRGIITIAE